MVDQVLVFVSHTHEMAENPDVESFLDGAEEAINAIDGAKAQHMAFFPAADVPPAEYSIRHLHNADIFVALIGFDYGSRVPNDTRSYTELEFDTATKLGKERLIFLLDPGSSHLQSVQMSNEQQRFRQKLQSSGATVAGFTDVGDLKFKVSRAVAQSIRDRTTRQPPKQTVSMPSPEAIEKGTRVFGVAALISALLMIAIVTGIGLLGWSAVNGSFPPWEAQRECADVAGRVTAALSSTFGSSTAGATLSILVENSSEETVSLPASRDVLARGASGRQYAQSQGLADQSWFFGVEVQPRSSAEVQLGLASASGGTDTVTVVIPNVRKTLLSRCEVILPSVEVSFAG